MFTHRQEIDELEKELMSLYSIYRKQESVIEGIERGTYTYSGKSIKVPEGEKPVSISREVFPIMFGLIEKNPEATKTKLFSSTLNTKKSLMKTGFYF